MTKSYNYIPTHFIYSSFLFFLLIFMYQLIHCHTLPKPFSQIFLFRIYAPTTYTHQPCLTLISTRPALRFQQIPRAHTAPTNQSTNDHRHTLPIPHPQIPHPHCPTNTRAHTPQTNSNRPPHTDTHPQTNTRRQAPTTLTLTPTHSTPSRPPPVSCPHTSTGRVPSSTGHTPAGQRGPNRSCEQDEESPR